MIIKKIKNESLQGLEVYLTTENGSEPYWLVPREVIAVPEHYVTDQAKTLHRRRMIKITNGSNYG